MSQKQKLIARLLSNPKDFNFDELCTLLSYLGYIQDNKGHTSGSRVLFVNEKNQSCIRLHKPHPSNIMREYQIKQLRDYLTQEGLI